MRLDEAHTLAVQAWIEKRMPACTICGGHAFNISEMISLTYIENAQVPETQYPVVAVACTDCAGTILLSTYFLGFHPQITGPKLPTYGGDTAG